MKNSNRLKILIIFIASSFLISCAKKGNNNIDFDFSTLKKTNKISTKKEIKNVENNLQIKDLVPLKNKEQVLSNTKFGKKDPFSKDDVQINQLNSDLKLTGFLNTENNKYAIVKYLNNEGKLTEESVGGLNTNLLPKGAKVLIIDPKNNKLIITFDNNNFIFEF